MSYASSTALLTLGVPLPTYEPDPGRVQQALDEAREKMHRDRLPDC